MAVTLGALAATMPGAANAPTLFALLFSGQVLGHLMLGTANHVHGTSGPPSVVMFAAHVAAVLVGAALIAAAGRLGDALSRAIHAATAPVPSPVWAKQARAVQSADHRFVPRQPPRRCHTGALPSAAQANRPPSRPEQPA
jgi:hypothetical protein